MSQWKEAEEVALAANPVPRLLCHTLDTHGAFLFWERDALGCDWRGAFTFDHNLSRTPKPELPDLSKSSFLDAGFHCWGSGIPTLCFSSIRVVDLRSSSCAVDIKHLSTQLMLPKKLQVSFNNAYLAEVWNSSNCVVQYQRRVRMLSGSYLCFSWCKFPTSCIDTCTYFSFPFQNKWKQALGPHAYWWVSIVLPSSVLPGTHVLVSSVLLLRAHHSANWEMTLGLNHVSWKLAFLLPFIFQYGRRLRR